MSLKDSGDEKKLSKVRPFESISDRFDDGAHSTIRQLVISYSEILVICIQIEYDDNGSSLWSEKHGQYTGPCKIDTIKLDYPNEYLISVHGKKTKIPYIPAATYICHLTFRSNKRTYGPYAYGKEDCNCLGENFSIQAPGKMIVGFYGMGRNFFNVRALGVYFKPVVEHNLKPIPSKVLDVVVPASPIRSMPLCQARHSPSQTKLRNKHDEDVDDDNRRQFSCIISNNQVKGNEGDRNGGFVVNTYFNTYYYYSEKFSNLDHTCRN